MTPILDRIRGPEDLKRLSRDKLPVLAREIRNLIIQVVSRNGGHLASNLGVVELTIALHRVFDSPRDKIIWDVGHQCYVHKLLTGRRERFATLRTLGGISGFPKRSESSHDIMDTGHASTSISAGLGLLIGQRIKRQEGKVIAVIGDGALSGGMALEALNQAGHLGKDLLIVLNDNKMSIESNVGAISSYLSRLTATRVYQSFQKHFDRGIRLIPLLGPGLSAFIYRLKRGLKALVFRESLFSDLGFEYVGPIDGHNMQLLVRVFRNVRKLDRPAVVHVTTIKGKGYIPAEGDPTLYHGVSPFSLVDGKLESKNALTFTEAFSDIMSRLAEDDLRLAAVTAAMADGAGLRFFQSLYRDRCYDVGIAEQHAVTFAAGLALAGLRPVVAIYSTFLQRAVDQVVHDVALPGLPVTFAVDRAGLVGADGETHHGIFDIALFRPVPGLTMIAPASQEEMELAFRYALGQRGPVMIRYPRASCPRGIEALGRALEPGRGVFVQRGGGEVLIASLGGMLEEAVAAVEILSGIGIPADLYNLRFIKPLDEDHLAGLASAYSLVCLLEEGVGTGGLGERMAVLLRERGVAVKLLHLCIPDRFIAQGSRSELLLQLGLNAEGIAAAVEQALVRKSFRRISVSPR